MYCIGTVFVEVVVVKLFIRVDRTEIGETALLSIGVKRYCRAFQV